MFRRIFMSALIAGFLGGAAISVVQQVTTTPIIHHAEQYEGQSKPDAAHHSLYQNPSNSLLVLTHGPQSTHEGEQGAWAPSDGLERFLFTGLANILTGTGFALILVACFALSRETVDGQRGVLWGLGGFAAISLAPALGLPPEVPGAMTADLVPRQSWWLLCVAATAAGLWMLVYRKGAIWMVAGIAAMALPHLIGAPQPDRIGGAVPPELAGHFAAASLVTAAIFWTILGWLSGTVWHRLGAR